MKRSNVIMNVVNMEAVKNIVAKMSRIRWLLANGRAINAWNDDIIAMVVIHADFS